MRPVARGLLAGLAFVAALAVTAPVVFFLAIVVAGPHAGLLPGFLEPVVLIAGWLVVLGVPGWASRAAWLRLAPRA